MACSAGVIVVSAKPKVRRGQRKMSAAVKGFGCRPPALKAGYRGTTVAAEMRRPPTHATTCRTPLIGFAGVRSPSKFFHRGREARSLLMTHFGHWMCSAAVETMLATSRTATRSPRRRGRIGHNITPGLRGNSALCRQRIIGVSSPQKRCMRRDRPPPDP